MVFEVFLHGLVEGCLVGPASGVAQLGKEHICCPGLVLAGGSLSGAADGSPARAEATGESLALPELGSPPQTSSP